MIIIILCIPWAPAAAADPQMMQGNSIPLRWDDSIDRPYLHTYRLYYGTESGVYSNTVDVGLVTEYTLSGLTDGTYYLALTAVDTRGMESVKTAELSATVKTIINPPLEFQFNGSEVTVNTSINMTTVK